MERSRSPDGYSATISLCSTERSRSPGANIIVANILFASAMSGVCAWPSRQTSGSSARQAQPDQALDDRRLHVHVERACEAGDEVVALARPASRRVRAAYVAGVPVERRR